MLSRSRQTGQILSVVLELFCAIVLMGCGAATTVTPLIRAGDTLTKPDRLLVYDFEVTPGEMDLERGFTVAISPGGNSDAQTDEEIQVGKAMAKALTGSVVRELRSRGIENVYRAADASAPGEDTASIKGRFLRLGQGGRTVGGFSLGSGQVRTHIWMFQGAGLTLRLVAENETATPSDLKRGIGTGLGSGESTFAAVETDASRIAKEVADRVVEYSRRRGWVD
jgi:hypothetical protein